MITTRLASGGIPSSLRRHSSLAGAVPGSGQAAVRAAAEASLVRHATSARTASAGDRRRIMQGTGQTRVRPYGWPAPSVKAQSVSVEWTEAQSSVSSSGPVVPAGGTAGGAASPGHPGSSCAQARRHDRDQTGIPRHARHVRELERIAVLVVQLLLVGRELHVLPGLGRLAGLREEPAHLGEVGNLSVPVLVQQVRPPRGRALVEERDETRALDAGVGRRAGKLREGLGEVDVERDARLLARLRDERLVPDDQRVTDAFLVLALLGLPAVRPPRVPVVGGIQDERVVEHAARRERLDDGGHRFVHRLQAFELLLAERIGLLLVLRGPRDRLHPRRLVRRVRLGVVRRPPGRHAAERPDVARGRRRGTVRIVGRELDEERFRRRPDEAHDLVPQHVGRVVRIGRAVGHVHPVLDEVVVEVAGGLEDVPLVPAGRLVGGDLVVSIQVLPEDARAVPGRFEPHGHGGRVVEGLHAAVRPAVGMDAGRVCVLPGEDAGTAGRTERRRHEVVLEEDTLLHQEAGHVLHHRGPAIEGVRLVDGVPALVVGEDEDDVRARGRRGGDDSAPERRQQRGR